MGNLVLVEIQSTSATALDALVNKNNEVDFNEVVDIRHLWDENGAATPAYQEEKDNLCTIPEFHYWDARRNAWETIVREEGMLLFTSEGYPEAVLLKLSALHPDAELKVRYANEDLGVECGFCIIKAGTYLSRVYDEGEDDEPTIHVKNDAWAMFAMDLWDGVDGFWEKEDMPWYIRRLVDCVERMRRYIKENRAVFDRAIAKKEDGGTLDEFIALLDVDYATARDEKTFQNLWDACDSWFTFSARDKRKFATAVAVLDFLTDNAHEAMQVARYGEDDDEDCDYGF